MHPITIRIWKYNSSQNEQHIRNGSSLNCRGKHYLILCIPIQLVEFDECDSLCVAIFFLVQIFQSDILTPSKQLLSEVKDLALV